MLFRSGKVLSYAWESAQNSGKYIVELPHLIHAMYELEESYAVYFMQVQGVEEAGLLQEMTIAYEEKDIEKQKRGKSRQRMADLEGQKGEEEEVSSGFWQQYAVCLNDALEGRNPLIGREEELERTMQILCRKEKNNPLHLGEPGVGKTAIVYDWQDGCMKIGYRSL